MTAFFLSALFPGLGQFYNHDGLKGALLVVGSLICLGLGGDQLMKLLLTIATTRPSGEVNSLGAWLGLLSGVLWIYAVIDAVVTAQKRNAGAGCISKRPTAERSVGPRATPTRKPRPPSLAPQSWRRRPTTFRSDSPLAMANGP